MLELKIHSHREKQPKEKQFEYYIKVPLELVEEAKLSIANRETLNRSSGLVRHILDRQGRLISADGVRIENGRVITDRKELRKYHWSYEQHLANLGFINEKGMPRHTAIVTGNRDLGNNFWHIAWERNKQEQLFHLQGEKVTERTYNCFVVWEQSILGIESFKFDRQGRVYRAKNNIEVSDAVVWLISGKPLVTKGKPLELSRRDIIEQFYDIRHVIHFDYPLGNTYSSGLRSIEKLNKTGLNDKEILAYIYANYPDEFAERALDVFNSPETRAARYYFNALGLTNQELVICQKHCSLEELAYFMIEKLGVEEAILLDEGGSVATWCSYFGPKGGFENLSSYFRPSALSVIGFKLRNAK